MSATREFKPSPDVLVSHLDGEAILLHLGTKRYFRLNKTGARIWQLLEGGSRTADIVRALVETFEVSPSDATREVDALLADLRECTLVLEIPLER